jgi:hypothetical protein
LGGLSDGQSEAVVKFLFNAAALAPDLQPQFRFLIFSSIIGAVALLLALIDSDVAWTAPGFGAFVVVSWMVIVATGRIHTTVFPKLLQQPKPETSRLGWSFSPSLWDLSHPDKKKEKERRPTFEHRLRYETSPNHPAKGYRFRPFMRGPFVITCALLSYFFTMILIPLKRVVEKEHAHWSDSVPSSSDCQREALAVGCDVLTTHIMAGTFWSMFAGLGCLALCTIANPSPNSLKQQMMRAERLQEESPDAYRFRTEALIAGEEREVTKHPIQVSCSTVISLVYFCCGHCGRCLALSAGFMSRWGLLTRSGTTTNGGKSLFRFLS